MEGEGGRKSEDRKWRLQEEGEETQEVPRGAEEMTGWGQVLEVSRLARPREGALPTRGLVLGEVTLLGEEGSGQQPNSTPQASIPVPRHHQLRSRAGDSFASQRDRAPDSPTLPPVFQALGFPLPLTMPPRRPLPPTSRPKPRSSRQARAPPSWLPSSAGPVPAVMAPAAGPALVFERPGDVTLSGPSQ